MWKNVFKVLQYLYYLDIVFKFEHKQRGSGRSPRFVNSLCHSDPSQCLEYLTFWQWGCCDYNTLT